MQIKPHFHFQNHIHIQISYQKKSFHMLPLDQNTLFKVSTWNDFFRIEFERNLDITPNHFSDKFWSVYGF